MSKSGIHHITHFSPTVSFSRSGRSSFFGSKLQLKQQDIMEEKKAGGDDLQRSKLWEKSADFFKSGKDQNPAFFEQNHYRNGTTNDAVNNTSFQNFSAEPTSDHHTLSGKSSIIQRDHVKSEGSCPTYEPNEITRSRTAAGWLPQDVTEHGSGELLFADFGNNHSNVKANALTEALWLSWKSVFLTDGSYRIQIIGYSDCSGDEMANINVRQGRAKKVESAFGTGIVRKLSFRGMAGLGQMVTDNAVPENRAKNRSVIIKYKQGFFFDTEAFSNAAESEEAIKSALLALGTSAETRERNVPQFIAAKGIKVEALTPRHDSSIITPQINFFTGSSSYAHSVVMPANARFHIYNSNASIAIQARNMPNIDGLASTDDIKERIVQAVSEVSGLAAAGPAAVDPFEQYKAKFNAWWRVAPYNTIDTQFNPALDSFGPRTNRAREIFKRIYSETDAIKNAYDSNAAGIKEKIDVFNIPEGYNLINSPRLQALREVFLANVPPVPDANYPAFKAAIQAASANLDSDDRQAVASSNDWQRLINQYISDAAKRREIIQIINTPVLAPPLLPAPSPPPAPVAGGGAAFLNHIRIDGPSAPITANKQTENVTLTPISDRNNPGIPFSTRFTITPAARVMGNNITAEEPWPSGSTTGIPASPEIANSGNITMNAHLDLVSMPSGRPAPSVPDFPFTINDNRLSNILSNWFPAFQYSKAGGNTEWWDKSKTVRYESGSQQLRISAWLPTGSVNPGLTLSVVSRLKKGGVVVLNNTTTPNSFPSGARSSMPIAFNITEPAIVPAGGDSYNVEVDIVDSTSAVLGTKTISFNVLKENVYTEAQAITEALDDNKFFHDNTATGLLGLMTAKGGIPARVAAAVNTPAANGGIVLAPFTARHDSANYVNTALKHPDPSQIGYFAGVDYSHSMVDVAGAAGFRTDKFPDLGPKVIVLNRTMDVVSKIKRANDSLITIFTHEAVHAMDERPGKGTELERYKTEFRAYWMDGRYGPPDAAICPLGSPPGSCFNADFDPNLAPPGPKSTRARIIFEHLYNDPVTYPFVKPAYDNNEEFRRQVDNYIYPDGINLIVSVRLERLRTMIENSTVPGFSSLRTSVRQMMGLEVPAPASGVLDAGEKSFIQNSRAWRDLVERKITDPAHQSLLKQDLGIPTAMVP